MSEHSLYKVLTPDVWAAAGETIPQMPVDRQDGYLHLSTADQLQETMARHFRGQGDVIVLELDGEALADDITWEPARHGQLFPHAYQDIPRSAIREVRRAYVDRHGLVTLLWPLD